MFVDRLDAGRQLARRLDHLRDPPPVVLGLPRGGVVVASEIARELHAPLDVLVVRKLGAPYRPELAIGAVIDGVPPRWVLNDDVIRVLGVEETYIKEEVERQLVETRRRQEAYRCGRGPVSVAGRTVIVVDDGIATGATARAAVTALGKAEAVRTVLAVPVGAADSLAVLRHEVDELICLHAPLAFGAVGSFYRHFDQTTDAEVVSLLQEVSGD